MAYYISPSHLGLKPRTVGGLINAGFLEPTPLQSTAIPRGCDGEDIIVSAAPGMGKGVIMAVLALEQMLPTNMLQVLLLTASRETALRHVHRIHSIGREYPGLQCWPFIGGTDVGHDILNIRRCHIAVATPGRIKRLIRRGAFLTESVKLLLIDRAHKLLQPDYVNDLRWIVDRLPRDKQVLSFFEDFTPAMERDILPFMHVPTVIRDSEPAIALGGVRHYTYYVDSVIQLPWENKVNATVEILRRVAFRQCIIFCNFSSRARTLHRQLMARGFPSYRLSSGMEGDSRVDVLSMLRSGAINLLITSDEAAGRINSPHVDFIIQFDVPRRFMFYVNRVGRAGRYGQRGTSIAIYRSYEWQALFEFEREGRFIFNMLTDPIPANLVL